jgi:hypothetical protein
MEPTPVDRDNRLPGRYGCDREDAGEKQRGAPGTRAKREKSRNLRQ